MNEIYLQSTSDPNQKLRLSPGRTSVGRHSENQIILNLPSVSRYHATFECVDEQVWVSDTDSGNGTLVNEKQLKPNQKYLLSDGDRVSFSELISYIIYGIPKPVETVLLSETESADAKKSFTPDFVVNAQGEAWVYEPETTLDDTWMYSSARSSSDLTEPETDDANGDQIKTSPRLKNNESSPDAASVSEEKNVFGFKSSEIGFSEGDIGANTVLKLSERFGPGVLIAQGGMGRIMLVQEKLSGRYVALKVMLKKFLNQQSLVDQFVREAVITARLHHPHVIPVHDLGFLGGKQLYYTMQYIEGQPFNKLIHQVSLEERLLILRDSALAVHYAHSQGLWHRDLKPHNILVGQFGDTYVTDWGLVSLRPGHEYTLNLPRIMAEQTTYMDPDEMLDVYPQQPATGAPAGSPTPTGAPAGSPTIIGTPNYMAPEQLIGDEEIMGAVSDIWAFGVMLFQILTKSHPLGEYATKNTWEIRSYLASIEKLPSPKELDKSVPVELNKLCQHMLAINAAQRMQSLAEFIEEMTAFLRSRTGLVSMSGMFASQNPDGGAPHLQMHLQMELQRYQQKVEILTEISQLGLFSGSRKRELWAKLAAL